MKDLYKDSSGKICAAKTAYMLSLAVCLVKILAHTFIDGAPAPDYTGMAAFLGALGAVYYGRSKTKADSNA